MGKVKEVYIHLEQVRDGLDYLEVNMQNYFPPERKETIKHFEKKIKLFLGELNTLERAMECAGIEHDVEVQEPCQKCRELRPLCQGEACDECGKIGNYNAD